MKSMCIERNILINWWMDLALHLGKVSSSGDKLYLLTTPGQ